MDNKNLNSQNQTKEEGAMASEPEEQPATPILDITVGDGFRFGFGFGFAMIIWVIIFLFLGFLGMMTFMSQFAHLIIASPIKPF